MKTKCKAIAIFLLCAAMLLGTVCVPIGAARQTEQHVNPFGDVKEKDWFYKDVMYAYTNGLFTGTTAATYAPKVATSRAMVVSVLWRMNGEPAPAGTASFKDVKKSAWYGKAVLWAAENNIVAGTGSGKYSPDLAVTREQIAVILYGYAQTLGMDTAKSADITSYPDYKKVSKWAREALAWANAEGLITGAKVGSETLLNPQGEATRAEVSSILVRFVKTEIAPPTKEEFAGLFYGLVRELGANTTRADAAVEFAGGTVAPASVPAVLWLSQEGVLPLDVEGAFHPEYPLTKKLFEEACSNFYYDWGNAGYVGAEPLPAFEYPGAFLNAEDMRECLNEFAGFCADNFTFASYIHKGINIDRYFNGYIENVDPVTGEMDPETYDYAYYEAVTNAPYQQIWDFGFDHLRIPMTLRDLFYEDGDGNLVPSEDAFGILDAALAKAKSCGLRAVFDPCGYSCWREEEDGSLINMRKNPAKYQDEYIEMWTLIAQRYRDYDPDWLAYELYNEPALLFDYTKAELFAEFDKVDEQTGEPLYSEEEKAEYLPVYEELLKDYDDDDIALWNVYQKQIYDTIRSIDTKKTLAMATTNCNLIDSVKHLDISYAKDDPYKILSIHHYAPHNFTMTYWTINKYTTAQSREVLAKIKKMDTYQRENNTLIWMSEFGVWRGQNHDEAAKYYADMAQFTKEYDIEYCLWDLYPFSDALDPETNEFHDFINPLLDYVQ